MIDHSLYSTEIENLKMYQVLSDEEKHGLLLNSKMVLNIDDTNKEIYKIDTPCQYVYIVLDGSVKMSMQDEEKEHINIILHKGQIFGECCLYGHTHTLHNAIVIEDKTKCLGITIEYFKHLLKTNFEFNLCVLYMIGEKIKKNDERLHNFATKDARQRILEFLKENVENNGKKIGLETLIKHGLTQQDIANFTGTSRQTVTTVLNDLKSKNKIHLRRKSILIRDIAALV
jgi:CRP/FNR family transcriptional regulator, cyclic AMP receptor protein